MGSWLRIIMQKYWLRNMWTTLSTTKNIWPKPNALGSVSRGMLWILKFVDTYFIFNLFRMKYMIVQFIWPNNESSRSNFEFWYRMTAFIMLICDCWVDDSIIAQLVNYFCFCLQSTYFYIFPIPKHNVDDVIKILSNLRHTSNIHLAYAGSIIAQWEVKYNRRSCFHYYT